MHWSKALYFACNQRDLGEKANKKGTMRLRNEKFALDSIDRCVFSYHNCIKGTKIIVDGKRVVEIADEILEKLWFL